MIRLARVPEPLLVERGVELHRITYWTEHLGVAVQASGLMAVPRGKAPNGTVTWLNGTNPTRAEAPSFGGNVAVLIAAAFAGTGHLLLAPDYIGLGTSKRFHPYMVTDATIAASTDFMVAAQAACARLEVPWNPRMKVVGFSQGAHAAVVIQQALESAGSPTGVELVATASIAPPLDVVGTAIPWGFLGASMAHSTYLAFIAHSYAMTYGHQLSSMFVGRYAELVPVLFDGEHRAEAITAALPADPTTMFVPGFISGYLAGESSWFRDAATLNSTSVTATTTPLRFYIGDNDVDVHPDDARRAASNATGGHVSLESVGPVDHQAAAYHAVPRVQRWFTTIR